MEINKIFILPSRESYQVSSSIKSTHVRQIPDILIEEEEKVAEVEETLRIPWPFSITTVSLMDAKAA